MKWIMLSWVYGIDKSWCYNKTCLQYKKLHDKPEDVYMFDSYIFFVHNCDKKNYKFFNFYNSFYHKNELNYKFINF